MLQQYGQKQCFCQKCAKIVFFLNFAKIFKNWHADIISHRFFANWLFKTAGSQIDHLPEFFFDL